MTQIITLTDCGFGDAGKGTMIDAYARVTNTHTVVRANGGAQAVHYVVTDDGRTHGFSQWGSATFVPGVLTYLSRFMCVSPTRLLEEAVELQVHGISNPFDRLVIHEDAPLLTHYHRAANWIRELVRGDTAHGTCGLGIGELMQDIADGQEDVLRMKDALDARTLAVKLRRVRARKRAAFAAFLPLLPPGERSAMAQQALASDDAFRRFIENCTLVAHRVQIVDDAFLATRLQKPGVVLFEGAQGVLLDEDHGFHPHTTWSRTTLANVKTLLAEHEGAFVSAERIGVLRTYATRHGAGPLPTYSATLTQLLPEAHNGSEGWQGTFRCGWFDLVATRYACAVAGGLTGIALTHMDRLQQFAFVKVAVAYRYHGSLPSSDLDRFFEVADADAVYPRLVGIRPGTGDLVRQEQLTAILGSCTPEYQSVPLDTLPAFLEQELCLPIAATSYGPTASAKRFHTLRMAAA